LLEEYVDGLHFYLSIGNELGIELGSSLTPSKVHDVLTLFALVNRYVAELWWCCHDGDDAAIAKYVSGFEHYLRLGEMLGFSWEEVEEAYLQKNAENHARQNRGY